MLAWQGSILFIPAWFMFLSDEQLARFGHADGEDPGASTLLGRSLHRIGGFQLDPAAAFGMELDNACPENMLLLGLDQREPCLRIKADGIDHDLHVRPVEMISSAHHNVA